MAASVNADEAVSFQASAISWLWAWVGCWEWWGLGCGENPPLSSFTKGGGYEGCLGLLVPPPSLVVAQAATPLFSLRDSEGIKAKKSPLS